MCAKLLPYFNWLNFWTAAVEDFWTANSGNIVAAASSSAESPDQSSNTTPVAKLNTFDYQGKIIVEILSLLLLIKGGEISEEFTFLVISANNRTKLLLFVNLKFKILASFFYIFLFDRFLLPRFKRVSLQNQAISKPKICQNSKFQIHILCKNTFWDYATFIVLSFVYLLILLRLVLSSLSIQWRKV